MTEYVDSELESELVIGLVGAVGMESDVVTTLLKERLTCAGYRVEVVKISRDVIPLIQKVTDHGRDRYKRISSLMDAGNAARKASGNDGVLALGAATIVRHCASPLPHRVPWKRRRLLSIR